MKRIKTILMAMVAVLAIGAVGASAASAGTGSGVISTSAGDCNFTLTHTGWGPDAPGYSTNVNSITKGTPCDVSSISGSANLYKEAIPSGQTSGYAEISADFTITALGGAITCRYTATMVGSWSWANPPTNTVKRFVFNGPVSATKVSGSFLCPNPVTVNSLNADVSYP